jgi:hypothetical protein
LLPVLDDCGERSTMSEHRVRHRALVADDLTRDAESS